MKTIKLCDFKSRVDKTNESIDKNTKINVVNYFFDKIVWTTLNAICIEKDGKTAWVARSVLYSIDYKEPMSIEVPEWVKITWKGKKSDEVKDD